MVYDRIFPDKYKVNYALGKKRFLEEGNLTPGEKQRIDTFLDNIQILYDIGLDDSSKMLVVWSKYNPPLSRKDFFLRNYCQAIASAFVCNCMLIVQNMDSEYVRVCLFEKAINATDPKRSSVKEVYISDYISDDDLERRFELYNEAIMQAASADELNYIWIDILSGFLPKCHHALRKDIEDFGTALSGYDTCDVEDYEEDSIKPEKSPVQNIFIEFCCAKSKKLFDETCDEISFDFSMKQWLIAYLSVCNSYYKQIFGESMEQSDMDTILDSMVEDYYVDEQFFEFDEAYLKEELLYNIGEQ